jgi:hypothetical protein
MDFQNVSSNFDYTDVSENYVSITLDYGMLNSCFWE